MLGETVSHYKIFDKLGEGGMGIVYLARDTKLDREVAIKFLPPHLSSDPEAIKRFVHEAKTASALNHSAIGVIHDINETDDGQTYIVMAFYDGGTLKDRIESGPMAPSEAVAIASQIASGLAAAHEKGIIHRDIKPQNILLTKGGQAKIIDFGLAVLSGRTRLTRDGSTLGTAAYMSPEQARGEEVDHRSDIFSLGSILYEMLVGKAPFSGEHEAALLYNVVHEEPVPISESGIEISETVQAIVGRALEKDSKNRYQDANELKRDLAVFMDETSASSSVRSRPAKNGSRRNILFAGIAGVAVIVALVAILWPKFAGPGRDEGFTLAVVDFNNVSSHSDSLRTAGMAGLLHVGLVENSPCRVLSPSYLKDIRRRLFDVTRGPIDESQALEIARKAGATVLLYGQMGDLDGEPYVAWQLVDTKNGESIAARRVDGSRIATAADEILDGVLRVLAPRCNAAVSLPVQSVTEITTADSEAYKFFVEAGFAFDQALWGRQRELLEKAVELDSTFALAHFGLSKAYVSGQNPAAAREHAEIAWKQRSRLSMRDRMRLDAWRDELEYRIADAIEVLRELHARWPDDKRILRSLSLMLWRWRYHREDLEIFRRGMNLYPDEAFFIFYNQATLSRLSRPAEALEGARLLVERHPDNANHWDELALRFVGAGLPDSAEVAMRRALEVDPKVIYPLFRLADLPYYRGDLKSSLEQHEKLHEEHGWRGYHMYMLMEAGRYEETIELIDEIKPRSAATVNQLVRQRWANRLFLQLGREEEVLRWTDNVVEELIESGKADDDPQLSGMVRRSIPMIRARALVALDSLQAAREIASEIRNGESYLGNLAKINALQLEAAISLKEGNPEAAIRALEQWRHEGLAGEDAPSFFYSHMLAEAHRMAGRLEEAEAVHRQVLSIKGGHALSHYHLGVIYEEMGRPQDAMQELSRFLDMWDQADEGIQELEDAKKRFAELQTN